ncbi:MAG: TIGR03936 family radical SAM-associated protein [Clostridia bacterium]|nr:TIGR03936 family radical SAM-associated protein [Clostridia bacterium]
MVPEEKIKVRIRFSKTGDLMYISHLDLARTMQRIILRAGLDIWYSEGFNPQPKMVFAVPLPTGVESNCEMLDIKLNSPMSSEEIKNRLNDNFPTEMRVLDVYTPEVKFKEIAYIDYTIKLNSPKITGETAGKIKALFDGECMITKKTKSGEKEVNISEYIKLLEADSKSGYAEIHTILASGNEMNLSPELLIEALRRNLDLMTSGRIDEYYSIMRNEMLTSTLEKFI